MLQKGLHYSSSLLLLYPPQPPTYVVIGRGCLCYRFFFSLNIKMTIECIFCFHLWIIPCARLLLKNWRWHRVAANVFEIEITFFIFQKHHQQPQHQHHHVIIFGCGRQAGTAMQQLGCLGGVQKFPWTKRRECSTAFPSLQSMLTNLGASSFAPRTI